MYLIVLLPLARHVASCQALNVVSPFPATLCSPLSLSFPKKAREKGHLFVNRGLCDSFSTKEIFQQQSTFIPQDSWNNLIDSMKWVGDIQ